jgi:hypothetical protein
MRDFAAIHVRPLSDSGDAQQDCAANLDAVVVHGIDTALHMFSGIVLECFIALCTNRTAEAPRRIAPSLAKTFAKRIAASSVLRVVGVGSEVAPVTKHRRLFLSKPRARMRDSSGIRKLDEPAQSRQS